MAVVAGHARGVRMRRLLSEQNLLLLLSFMIAVTSWYYVTTSRSPRAGRTTTKTVAVVPTIVGEPAYGYSLIGIRVYPLTVDISGDPVQLAQVDRVVTDHVVISGATRDVTRDVAVVGPPELVKSVRVRVRVDVQIAPAIAVTVVRGVRVHVQNAPRGLLAQVEPDRVEVQVQGPVTVVSRLRAADISARVDGATFAEGRVRVLIKRSDVQAPPQVEVLEIRPSAVTVVVRRG